MADRGRVVTGVDHTFLVTDAEFDDFDLSLEWRVTKGGNGGIFYLVPAKEELIDLEKRPEFNLMDDSLNQYNKTGALYKAQDPTTTTAVKPIGSWNSARLVKRGGKVEHWINEQMVCSYDLNDPATRERWKRSQLGANREFASGTRGCIALQAWTSEISYRNVVLREPGGGATGGTAK